MSEFRLEPYLVEEEELFETTNPALLKIVAFKQKYGPVAPETEPEFMRRLPEIVDRVMNHFQNKGKVTA
jgi:hypothetical protein